MTGLPGAVDGGTMVIRWLFHPRKPVACRRRVQSVNMTGSRRCWLANSNYATQQRFGDRCGCRRRAAGDGVKAADVFAAFGENIVLKRLVRAAIDRVADERTHALSTPRRCSVAVRAAMRLVDRRGHRVDAALRAAGHDVVGVDALRPSARAKPGAATGCQRVDVRDASALAPLLAGVDLVVTRPPWRVPVNAAARTFRLWRPQRFATTVLLAQMLAAGVRLVPRRRWWFTGRGAGDR